MATSSGKTRHNFSAGQAVSYGWSTVTDHLGFFILITLLVFIVSFIPSYIGDMAGKEHPTLSAVASIIGPIIEAILTLGIINICLKLYNKKKVKFDDLFVSGATLIKYVGAVILTGLIVLAGFILLIIPGLIFAIRLQMVPYLVVDKQLGAVEAIKKSWAMTKGQAWRLFWLGIVLGFVNLLGFLALGVGILVTYPLTQLALVYVYQHLAGQAGHEVDQQPEAAAA
jgi:uncharacterized membrane protein